jgi:transcriptional regulator with XRE-family HTH domain
MTQEQLAEAADTTQPVIARFERGGRKLGNASGDTLVRLSRALGVTVDELLKEE